MLRKVSWQLQSCALRVWLTARSPGSCPDPSVPSGHLSLSPSAPSVAVCELLLALRPSARAGTLA